MSPNDSKMQNHYDTQMKDWKNCLVSIARKLSRQLEAAQVSARVLESARPIGNSNGL
jgi:hypothetical protein